MRSPAWIIAAALAGVACDAAPPRATPQLAPPPPPEIVAAPAELGSIQGYVSQEVARAARDRRTALVYVGAAWCEPCRRFHDALASGALDRDLPGLRFLELDYDKQREALSGAGYGSKLLPLFSLANADGTPSARRIEGSIKGETAVRENLVPRLRALLDAGP